MALTGYLHQSQCFASLADATAAHWSREPVAVTPGSPSILTDVVYDGSAWVMRSYSVGSGGASLVSSVSLPPPTFPRCDPFEPFQDGMLMGSGVAAAMILAFIIRIQGWATR
ncbi:hypothetical protein [Azonexus sp.]|uniref:hypothetical protein n=1 Tax=Azonexus sp. TaxID=1872668 RepID=UPI0035B10C3D